MKREFGTYNPKINDYKGDKPISFSNFGKEGMVNYFERVHMAKSRQGSYTGK